MAVCAGGDLYAALSMVIEVTMYTLYNTQYTFYMVVDTFHLILQAHILFLKM